MQNRSILIQCDWALRRLDQLQHMHVMQGDICDIDINAVLPPQPDSFTATKDALTAHLSP